MSLSSTGLLCFVANNLNQLVDHRTQHCHGQLDIMLCSARSGNNTRPVMRHASCSRHGRAPHT